jgi:hypothetical protein
VSVTFQYVATHPPLGRVARHPAIPVRSMHQDLGRWEAWLLRDVLSLVDLDELTTALSGQGGRTVGVYVEMSDWGYCVGASDGGVDFRVLTNDFIAMENAEGRWVVQQGIASAGSSDWKHDAARRIELWAAKLPPDAAAPDIVHADDVLTIISKSATFADDPLNQLTRMLGIPSVRWPQKHEWSYDK